MSAPSKTAKVILTMPNGPFRPGESPRPSPEQYGHKTRAIERPCWPPCSNLLSYYPDHDGFRNYEVEDALENTQATISPGFRPRLDRRCIARRIRPRWTWPPKHRLPSHQQPRPPVQSRRHPGRLAHLHRHPETRRHHDTARRNNPVSVDWRRRHRSATHNRRRRLGVSRCRDEALVGFLAITCPA